MNIKNFNPDAKIKELKECFRLDGFTLVNWDIRQTISPIGETTYVLEMEFLPPEIEARIEEEYNPPGAVLIEWEIELNCLLTFIMVEGIDKRSFLTNGATNHLNRKNISKSWIQNWLLISEEEYELYREEENEGESEFGFRPVIKGIPMFPGGMIHVRVDHRGQVTFYTVHGIVPTIYKLNVNEEFSTFTGEKEKVARGQLRRFALPNFDSELLGMTYRFYYGIEEIFLKSNGEVGSSYEVMEKLGYVKELHLPVCWKDTEHIEKPPIKKRYMDRMWKKFREETTFKYVGPPAEIHPDLEVINDSLLTQISSLIKGYLKNVVKAHSGEYQIYKIWRDSGLIQVSLTPVNPELYELQKKLLFIEPSKLEIVQIFEKPAYKMSFSHINISMEEAWAKIAGDIMLKPYFVLERNERRLMPMYLMDSKTIIDAQTGDICE